MRLGISVFFIFCSVIIYSQKVTIDNFSGRSSDFWEEYFKSDLNFHQIEGIYLRNTKGYNEKKDHETSDSRKIVVVQIKKKFYVLLSATTTPFDYVRYNNGIFYIEGKKLKRRGNYFNFWGNLIEILNEDLLLLQKFPVSLNIKSDISYSGNGHYNEQGMTIVDGKILYEELQMGYRFRHELIKITTNNKKRKNKDSFTGTAFQIDSNYLVTNSHVVKGNKSLSINYDNETLYLEVVIDDIRNDIAVLRVLNKTLLNVPYGFNVNKKRIGESIFTLGYPLTSTMGEEIKLTNGIISSTKGYNDDITTLQTTIAVQPGNSGGPVFDKEGNIIGIISSKHSTAENASYAIKLRYLENILDELNVTLSKPIKNIKSMSDKAEKFSHSIFLITNEQ